MRARAILASLLLTLMLAGCAAPKTQAPPTSAPESETAAAPTPAAAAENADEDKYDESVRRLAEAQKNIRTRKLGRYGMVPVYGRDVCDGVYPIHVDSSSPFFRIAAAELIVENGEMYGRITIPSMSYLYVYPGTKFQADKASEEDWIGFEEVDHHTVFTLPIEALDKEVECAAYSKAREIWYDRHLVFYASSLPKEALRITLPDYELIEAAIRAYDLEGVEELLNAPEAKEAAKLPPPEAVAVELPDGEYSIEVNMTGGSGRASVSSPTLLIVRGGKAYARLLWSSAYYDYMILEDHYYLNETTDGGNSTFEVPITAMDEGITVIADTTAMGDPVEIEYVLTFYQESVGRKSDIPQEAAKKVLTVGGAMIILGGILNYFVKKKRNRT